MSGHFGDTAWFIYKMYGVFGYVQSDEDIRQAYQRRYPRKHIILDHNGMISRQEIFRPSDVIVRVEGGVVTHIRID